MLVFIYIIQNQDVSSCGPTQQRMMIGDSLAEARLFVGHEELRGGRKQADNRRLHFAQIVGDGRLQMRLANAIPAVNDEVAVRNERELLRPFESLGEARGIIIIEAQSIKI